MAPFFACTLKSVVVGEGLMGDCFIYTGFQIIVSKVKIVSHSVLCNSLWPPWTVACQAPLSMEFSKQEYWSRSLLQGIFPTQGLNLGPLHCRWILYHLSHQGRLFQRYLVLKTSWWKFETLQTLPYDCQGVFNKIINFTGCWKLI